MADANSPGTPGWGNSADAKTDQTETPPDVVSRDELKKVIAERDAYKKRLRRLQQASSDRSSDGPVPFGGPLTGEPTADATDPTRMRDEAYRRSIAEKDRTIARLLIDNEIAAAAARFDAHDPASVVKLARDLFSVRDGRVILSDGIEDAGLARFDDEGNERTLPDVVAEFLSRNDYLVKPTGAHGAGSRPAAMPPGVSMNGMTQERFARLSPAEKDAVRRMAGVPGRVRVW